MKYLALFGVIIFLLFAAVQINDPDPYIWIPVYLFAAVMSFLAFRGKYIKWLLFVSGIAYLIFSIYTFPPSLYNWVMDEINNTSLTMKTPSMEEARESLGSLVCFIFMASYFFYSLFRKRPSKYY